MQRTRNGSAAAPAIGRRIVDFEFALAAEAADNVDFPPTSATATSVRDEGIGLLMIQRPMPWAKDAVTSRAPQASSTPPRSAMNLHRLITRSLVGRHSRNGIYGISWPIRGSVRLDARELDHLGPLLGFLGNEFPEIGGRERDHGAAEVGKPRLDLGISKAGVDLLV